MLLSFSSTGQSCAHLYLTVPCLLEPRRMSLVLFQRHPFQRTSISSLNHHLHKNKTKSDQQRSEFLWIWLTFSKPIHVTLNKWQANDAIECSHLIKMMSSSQTFVKIRSFGKILKLGFHRFNKRGWVGGWGGGWQLSPSHAPVPRIPPRPGRQADTYLYRTWGGCDHEGWWNRW